MVNVFDYYIDYVLCVDGSAGMRPLMDGFKRFASSIHERTKDGMEAREKSIGQIRVKIIVFRDYALDEKPMEESRFFTLYGGEVDDTAEYLSFVNGIEAKGGWIKSNSLEALALAMRSDWEKKGISRRHFIYLLTNAEPVRFQERRDRPGYPEDMPVNLDDLCENYSIKYYNMDPRASMMCICAPDGSLLTEHFRNYKHTFVSPLPHFDLDQSRLAYYLTILPELL